MLYTRKGDRGTSGLFGTSDCFPKDHPVYEALGTLDELNALLGVCKTHTEGVAGVISLNGELGDAQEALFIIQAELAGSDKRIALLRVEKIEHVIDAIEIEVGNPHAFIVAGATPLSAFLDYARTVARRAERAVIAANRVHAMSEESLAYLNRLSSLLYALARYAAAAEGIKEPSPSYT